MGHPEAYIEAGLARIDGLLEQLAAEKGRP